MRLKLDDRYHLFTIDQEALKYLEKDDNGICSVLYTSCYNLYRLRYFAMPVKILIVLALMVVVLSSEYDQNQAQALL